MSTKKEPTLIEEVAEENEFDEALEDISEELDQLTMAVPQKVDTNGEPRVSIILPVLEGDDTEGITVDQYEHVTIGNEKGEKIYYVRRGEYVDVPVSVYMVLKQKYPKL